MQGSYGHSMVIQLSFPCHSLVYPDYGYGFNPVEAGESRLPRWLKRWNLSLIGNG
ncbi:MAG: hypothetical protein ACLFM7_12795 [Bacteroidales bacterium]